VLLGVGSMESEEKLQAYENEQLNSNDGSPDVTGDEVLDSQPTKLEMKM